MIPIEVQFRDSETPVKLTVSEKRIAVKIPRDAAGTRLFDELAGAARVIHEELSPMDRTLRGYPKFRQGLLVITLKNNHKNDEYTKTFQLPSLVTEADLEPKRFPTVPIVVSEERLEDAIKRNSRKEFRDLVQKARDEFSALSEETQTRLRNYISTKVEQ